MQRENDNVPDAKKVRQVRECLLQIFKKLRREGFIARANFLCCQDCALKAIQNRVTVLTPDDASRVKGVVFWHHQDEQSLKKHGIICISFGQLNTLNHGFVGLDAREVGNRLAFHLKERGIDFSWDGSPRMAIRVNANSGVRKECGA